MEYLAEALKPIKVVVWGEMAIDYLGAQISGDVRFSSENRLSFGMTWIPYNNSVRVRPRLIPCRGSRVVYIYNADMYTDMYQMRISPN